MRTSLIVLSFTLAAAAFSYACGGDTNAQIDSGTDADNSDTGDQPDVVTTPDAGSDVDNGNPSTTYPAFKVDAPQVVDFGGNVLATPKVVPVYFGNDVTAFTAQITTFLNKLPASTYWGPSLTEYGVGAITITAPVQLVESAGGTLTDADIQGWLGGKLTNNDPAFPAPDANTVYALFYPTGTSISLGQGQNSCQSFGGYHDSFAAKGMNIAYAVIPRCASFGGLTGIDSVSATTSHELIEASTDPFPNPQNDAAYASVDDNHIIWSFVLGGGETGDMCAQNPDAFFKPVDLGVYVQRTWSNVAAKAGHDPCQPADTSAYFNSMPVLTETLNLGGGQIVTKGITIPVGQSKTVEVDLFSDKATSGPWTVKAIDSAQLQGQPADLNFAWDKTSGVNGEKLHLTITVKTAGQFGAEAFLIESSLAGKTNLWVGLVGN